MKIRLALSLVFALSLVGLTGESINFDGTDDYINVGGGIGNPGTSDFSISAWINFTSSATYKSVASKGQTGAGDVLFYVLRSTDAGQFIRLYVDRGAINVQSTTEVIGGWFHIAAVRLGTTGYIYVNGIQENSDVGNPNINNAHNWIIGAAEDGGARLAMGDIADVAIYNRALTVSEIQAINASEGAWLPKNDIAGYWPMKYSGFSTGQAIANGTTILDTSGQGQNGTTADGIDNSMTVETSPTRSKRGRR